MGDPKDYCKRWRRNAGLARVCPTRFIDGREWTIVLCFYAAVHAVEGYMRTKPERFWSEDHSERVKRIKLDAPEIKVVARLYRDLQDLSESVRYQPTFEPREEDYANAKELLRKIEAMVKFQLCRAAGVDPATV